MSALRFVLTKFDRFLFDSLSPVMCSVIRIAYATLLLIFIAAWIADANIWFTENGVLRAETAQAINNREYWSVFFWLPQRAEFIYVGLGILLLQTLLLWLGCWSRLQAVGIFLWLTSFQHRNPLICDGEDTVFRLFAFFMIFMPLDYAWSLRKRNAHKASCLTTEAASAWALRLMQFQVTAIYLSTAWSKWQGTTWRDGTALYYVSRMDDIFGRFWMPPWLFEIPWIVKTATWGVLGVETALPWLLWYRPTRWIAIILAFGLHLAIEYSMHLFLFEWVMVVGLLSFVHPSEWRFALPFVRNKNPI
jgi:hypothetical protein